MSCPDVKVDDPKYQAFLNMNADDEDALLDALEELLPNRPKAHAQATSPFPREYIHQLDLIEMGVDVKMRAVLDFLTAELMHERWKEDRIDKRKIKRHCDTLREKYQQVFNTNKGHENDTETSKVENGRHIFDETMNRVENFHTHGLPFVRRMNEGELHRLSDARDIGWHPDWENRHD